jgi:succinoglycan biosynthesis protein ExoA
MRPKELIVTAIVPVEPGGDPGACLEALRATQWPAQALEILVVRGEQPSKQRNVAAASAKGEWLLFLDSDARPSQDLISRLLESADAFQADVVGGPNLPPLQESVLGGAFSAVLGSFFGSMSARARYASIGKARLTTEKELILCNMAVTRSRFLQLGGFREDLYPNEENEFLNRLQARGGRLAYDPLATVRRPRRHSVAAFALQALRYGRGRMRQMKANFFPGDLIHLLPLAALSYLCAVPFLYPSHPMFLAPLLAYAAADLVACLEILARGGGHRSCLLALVLFPLRHLSYGLGLAAGLTKAGRRGSPVAPITIEKIRK